jgi:FlgD Ig-like domain
MKKTIFCLLVIILATSGAWAQTTLTVDQINGPYTTIQAAIIAAGANDIILVTDGIYNENVNVNKAVTLVSVNGSGFTTIQGSAAQATAAGGGNTGTLCLSVDGITIGTGTMDGFTIIGYDWTSPAIEHAALYIKGSLNGNLSIIGNSLVADGEAAITAEYGCITGGNVEIANNTFSGQTYVGTTVGGDSSVQFSTPNVPRSMVYFGGGNIDIYFHDNVLSGSVGAIIEGTGDSYYNTGATIDCQGATSLANGAVIDNNTITIPSWAALRARGGYSTVTNNDFDTSVSGEYVGAYYQNYETGVFANNQRYLVPGMTLQQAHDTAFPGDVVNVPAGVFEEQLHITTNNLVFTGAGSGDNPAIDTILLCPVSLTWFYTTSANNYPILALDGVTQVTVQNFRVDGAGRGNANYRFQGIGFWNSGGNISNVNVVNVIDTPFSGAQHGVGVYAYNDTGGPYTVNLTGVNVLNFQKGAMALNGAGLTSNVIDCTTTGVGPTDVTAQNGIQIWGGDGGTISGCSVTGNIYTGEDWAASGILLIEAGTVALSNTTVADGDPCVYSQDTNTTADELVINNNHVDSGNGFYTRVDSGILLAKAGGMIEQADPSPFGDYSGKATANKGTASTTITNSTFTGQTTGYGISASNFIADDLIDLTVTNCAVKNWGWGVVMFASGGDISSNFHDNGFIDNDGFFYAADGLLSSQDATGNYWGTNVATDLSDAIFANIVYTPWLAGGTENLPGFSGDFSEVYVDDDGAPAGATGLIQDAIDLVSGSTVNVAAGMYPGNLILPTNLNLLGVDGAAVTTIAGSGGTAVTVAGDNVLVDGFTITNPTGHYAVSSTDNSNITVSNNIVTDIGTATTTGYVHAVVFVCTSEPVDGITIEDNVLHAIHADEYSSASAIAVGWTNGDEDVTNLLIQRNTIYNIRSNTSAWNLGHGAYGILLSHAVSGAGQTINPQILDNTIYDLEGLWAHGIGLEGNTPGAVVTGNEISNLVDHKSPSDAVAVMIEDNPGAGTLLINNNSFTDLAVGMVSTNEFEVVNALNNWWDSSSGPYNPDTNPLGTGNAVGPYINYNPWVGVGNLTVSPSASGPLMCGQQVTLTFNLTTDTFTPDVFGYNAIVRVDSDNEVLWGTIRDLEPFTDDGNQFLLFDQGDGSWIISGTTVGSPAHPIVDADTYPLFSIEFTTAVSGLAEITLDNFTLRDTANQPITASANGATILVDCIPPQAVTGITADPHHNRVEVNWVHDGLDVDHYEVFSGLWHDGSHASVYPEYDDAVGNTEPTRPADYAAMLLDPLDEWDGLGNVAGLTTDQIWSPAARGVFYYEVYAVDAAGNASPRAAAIDRATNYWLGDVSGDGEVTAAWDMDPLGNSYGLSHGEVDYNNFCDVGPTDSWSPFGIPTTDSRIDFEDLMMFSMNFGLVDDTNKSQSPIAAKATLAWTDLGNNEYALQLLDGVGIKGIHVRSAVAEGSISGVIAGQMLDDQSEMTFLKNIGNALDVSVAVTGAGTGFTGVGALFIVSSNAPIDVADLNIEIRGHDNSSIEMSLEAAAGVLTPRVFALEANYPNPFNPMTKISFSLPETQNVRLAVYGIDGKRVATLVNETRAAGLHEVLWKGRDDAGQSVASGMYFYRIEAGPYSQVRKMTLMK